MMRRILVVALLLAATVAQVGPVQADPVPIRVADLATYGRIIIRLGTSAPPTVTQNGDRVEISAPGSEVKTPDMVPRNVTTFAGKRGAAEFTMVPGARLKTEQNGKIFVLVVLDPAARADPATKAARPNPAAMTASAIGEPAGRAQSSASAPAPAPAEAAAPKSVTAPTGKHDVPGARPNAEGAKAATPAADLPQTAAPAPATSTAATPPAQPAAPATVPHPPKAAPGREAGTDPGTAKLVEPAATPAPTQAAPTPAAPTPAAPAQAAPTQAAPSPATSPEPASAETASSDEPETPSIRVAAGPDVGAVAFQRGTLGFVVFDETLPVTLDDDGDRFRDAQVQSLTRGTLLTVTLGEKETLALVHEPDGWVVRVAPATGTPATETSVPEGIAFQFFQPGRAMTVADPITEQVILLGTVRQAGIDRSLVGSRRSGPGYVLLPTWLGLALEANSDAVDLRTSANGFTLLVPDRDAPAKTAAPAQTNPFAIPNAPTDALMRQLAGQTASAAKAPPRGRGPERVAAARTMLALGMAPEAQALLNLASNDDPSIAADPKVAALTGIAAVLAGRPSEAGGLDDAALEASVDVVLWRGLRDAALNKPNPALGAAWPALATYPDAIRRRIAATVLMAAVKSGVPVPSSELSGASFALARAEQKAAAGETEPALEAFDAVANGADERDSVRAAVSATELRLSKGLITTVAAADRIDRQTVRWRGDGQEIALRLRVAELRTQVGQWRAALDNLQQSEALFPDARPRIAALRAGVFRSLLAADEKAIKPLELVTIAGDFADKLPEGADGERLAGLLADKLAALDLPSRAIPVLQRLVERSESPAKRAEFAVRLAQLELDAGDPAKAEAALSQLDPTGLAPEVAERRLFMLARTRADRGDPAGGAVFLSAIASAAADETRASLLAKAGDWPGSLKALQSLAARVVPEQGELTDQQQDIVLRQATAAVQAGDADALKKLKRWDARLSAPRTDLFRVLTATAVRGPEDLPRAAKELAASRGLPDRLSALKLR